MIPVRVIEALELKHDIFREEKGAIEVMKRAGIRSTRSRRPTSAQARLAGRLVSA